MNCCILFFQLDLFDGQQTHDSDSSGADDEMLGKKGLSLINSDVGGGGGVGGGIQPSPRPSVKEVAAVYQALASASNSPIISPQLRKTPFNTSSRESNMSKLDDGDDDLNVVDNLTVMSDDGEPNIPSNNAIPIHERKLIKEEGLTKSLNESVISDRRVTLGNYETEYNERVGEAVAVTGVVEDSEYDGEFFEEENVYLENLKAWHGLPNSADAEVTYVKSITYVLCTVLYYTYYIFSIFDIPYSLVE